MHAPHHSVPIHVLGRVDDISVVEAGVADDVVEN